MAKLCFRERRFHGKTKVLIATANEILERYAELGIRLTLRQVYYQFVARHGLPNNHQSYKMLGKALSEGRLAGLVDWDAIVDRVRAPELHTQWREPQEALRRVVETYRRHRFDGQDHYVEVWVEKDALASVIQPLTDEFHVVLMVNRGYSSQTAMFESAARLYQGMRDAKTGQGTILYIGDHDPSGEDMVRDIGYRLGLFGLPVEDGGDLSIHKLALTMDQISEYKPPPNPVKSTDSRTPDYQSLHGKHCWEVDALDPEVLQKLIRDALGSIVDLAKQVPIKAQEEKDKARLTSIINGWNGPGCTPPCKKKRRAWEKKQAAKAKAAEKKARVKAQKAAKREALAKKQAKDAARSAKKAKRKTKRGRK